MREQELKSIKRTLEGLIKRIDNVLDKENETPLKDMTPMQKGEYVVHGVCDFWEMSKEDFLKKNNSMGRRRQYAAALMRDYTTLTQREIAGLLGMKHSNSAFKSISVMDELLSDQSWGDGRARGIYESLIKYLELPPSKYYKYGKS